MITHQVIGDIVMYDSSEAASKRSVTGWVSRDGRFYGTNEHMARWAGCTHRKCDQCDEVIEKSRTICAKCQEKLNVERYNGMPEDVWDQETMLYSDAYGEYFSDLDAIDEWMEDPEVGGTLADMRLIICKPNYPREIDADYFSDEIDDGDDLPDILREAMGTFNEAIKKSPPLSWSPGRFRLKLQQDGTPATKPKSKES